MQNIVTTIKQKLEQKSYLDSWTAIHMLAGAVIAKGALIIGEPKLWAILSVVGLGVLWEIVEWKVEKWFPYGSIERWRNNTISDLVVEIGMAMIVVL